MRRTARISAAYAPRGARRIGAAPGDERARTGKPAAADGLPSGLAASSAN